MQKMVSMKINIMVSKERGWNPGWCTILIRKTRNIRTFKFLLFFTGSMFISPYISKLCNWGLCACTIQVCLRRSVGKKQSLMLNNNTQTKLSVGWLLENLGFLIFIMFSVLLGTALPGFRSYKPPWLRLSQRPWDHKPLRRQSLSPWQGSHPCPLYFTLLGPEPDQLANDG